MSEKRINKFPNNRYDSKNKKRTKKISQHVIKEKSDKPNRNGFAKETIPGKTEYHLRAPKLEQEKSKSSFFQSIFLREGYYHYLMVPFVILILTIILDFTLQFAVYTNANPAYVAIAKSSAFFFLFSVALICINICCFIFIGLELAKHNIQFKNVISLAFKIVLCIFVIESIFTLFAYFTFLNPYIVRAFASKALQSQYLFYLITWNLIKAVLYLFLATISHTLFFKLKFV